MISASVESQALYVDIAEVGLQAKSGLTHNLTVVLTVGSPQPSITKQTYTHSTGVVA